MTENVKINMIPTRAGIRYNSAVLGRKQEYTGNYLDYVF